MAARGRSSHSSGQAAVEFALVSVVFLVLLIGCIDVARFIYSASAVTNAAREGARYGIHRVVNGPNQCFQSNPALESAAQAASQGVNISNSITVTAGTDATLGNYCQVQVSWTYKPAAGLLRLPTIPVTTESRAYFNDNLT